MKADIKEKWLEALRSDKFVQGTGALKYVSGLDYERMPAEGAQCRHCCLGVLCEVIEAPFVQSLEDAEARYYRVDGSTSSLSSELQYEVGMTYPQQSHLINMNDRGETFAEIADWIERNL